jgi:dihydrofolate synthase/folylpolyglutamate synthase
VTTDWLFRLRRLGIRPGLEAIGELLEALGHPERAFPAIVVAGTNGKGTAAIALEALSRSAGLRTGLYTSPHLLDVRERIHVDGRPIAHAQLIELVREHRSTIERLRTTFFESLTALTLLHFAREGVELAVLEAGLGGRLDATNVVRKAGVLLTSVGLDHTELLGPDLESIAREKLGLAECGVPFYIDQLDPEVRVVAETVLERVGAPYLDMETLRAADQTLDVAPEASAIEGWRQRLQLPRLAAVYRDLAQRHGWPLANPASAFVALRAPGRYDVWGHSPRLVLDTAHNVQALRGVLQQWREESDRERRILVFATMADKQVDDVLLDVVGSARTVLVTAPRWYRAQAASVLADRLRAVAGRNSVEVRIEAPGSVRATLEEARRRALTDSLSDASPSILVTGSNFVVAEALDRLGVDDLQQLPPACLWDEGRSLRRREHAIKRAAV